MAVAEVTAKVGKNIVIEIPRKHIGGNLYSWHAQRGIE
jgi:UDP-galactopyranose mutase